VISWSRTNSCALASQKITSVNNSAVFSSAPKMQTPTLQSLPSIDRTKNTSNSCAFTPMQSLRDRAQKLAKPSLLNPRSSPSHAETPET
jgi:hypothetical protein